MDTTKNKALGYVELGALLKQWRSQSYRSAYALCEAAKFDFSYGVYAAYERGEDLATPDALLAIATFLGTDVREAMVLWANAQMPNAELKKFFSIQNLLRDRRSARGAPALVSNSQYSVQSNSIPQDELDNIWLFGSADRRAFEEHPWLFHLLVRMHMMQPEPLKISDLGITDRKTFEKFTATYFARWIDDNKIKVTQNTIALVQRYFHVPKTEEWQDFRKRLLDSTIKSMNSTITEAALKEGRCYRMRFTKYFTAEQRAYISTRLGALEREIFALPYDSKSEEPKESYAIVALLAPCEYNLPQDVLARLQSGKKSAKKDAA